MGANPNTMDFKDTWDDVYQITHYKQPAYKAIADESIEPKLQEGQTFHRTYTSDFTVNDMGADGSYSTQALTDSDETLTVNKVKEVSFYVKKLDELQAHLPVRVKYAQKAMNRLFLQIDGDVFSTAYQGASSAIDDGSLGGTSGNGISVTVANVAQIFTASQQQLQLNNVIYDPNAKFSGQFKLDRVKNMMVAIISAQVYQQLVLYVGGKNSHFGDTVSQSGHAGMFMGFNMFISNNLAWTGTFALSVTPTANDTVTINGVTFTFVSTIGSTPGNVLFTSATDANTNLTALINAPGTTTANGVALSAANQAKMKNFTATANTNVSTTIVAAGWGNVVVSQVMTSASNLWTLAKQIQHNLFGVNNSISLVIQRTPMFEINPVSGKVGKDFITWVPYGLKMFKDQTTMIVDVQVRSDSFTAPSNTFN